MHAKPPSILLYTIQSWEDVEGDEESGKVSEQALPLITGCSEKLPDLDSF